MKLSTSDQVAYPKLTEYLKNSFPKVKDVPKIVANLKTYGSLEKADSVTATSWGTDPLIVVKDLSNFQCGVEKAYGCFVYQNPNQIELDKGTAQKFETDPTGSGTDGNVYVVGATLLHELCHWGNHKNSVTEQTEQGLAFERATYGKIVEE